MLQIITEGAKRINSATQIQDAAADHISFPAAACPSMSKTWRLHVRGLYSVSCPKKKKKRTEFCRTFHFQLCCFIKKQAKNRMNFTCVLFPFFFFFFPTGVMNTCGAFSGERPQSQTPVMNLSLACCPPPHNSPISCNNSSARLNSNLQPTARLPVSHAGPRAPCILHQRRASDE